jgi:hypothetical protein
MPFVVGHSLSFLEFVITYSFDIRHVKKHVLSGPSVNETKTLVRQLLDCTFSHHQSDSNKKLYFAALLDTTGSSYFSRNADFTD